MDLSKVSLEKGSFRISINTVFGSGILRIDPQIPPEIRVDSVKKFVHKEVAIR